MELALPSALVGFTWSEEAGATLFYDQALWAEALERERAAPFIDRPFDHVVRALPRHP